MLTEENLRTYDIRSLRQDLLLAAEELKQQLEDLEDVKDEPDNSRIYKQVSRAIKNIEVMTEKVTITQPTD